MYKSITYVGAYIFIMFVVLHGGASTFRFTDHMAIRRHEKHVDAVCV